MNSLKSYPELLKLAVIRGKQEQLCDDLLLSDFLFAQYQQHPDWFTPLDFKTPLRAVIKNPKQLLNLRAAYERIETTILLH